MQMPETLFKVLEITESEGTYYGKYLSQQFGSVEDAFLWLGLRYSMKALEENEKFLNKDGINFLVPRKYEGEGSTFIVGEYSSLIWEHSGSRREIKFK